MTFHVSNRYRALNAVLLDGTKVQFTCEAGHTFIEDLGYPRGKKHPARMNRTAVEQLVRHWAPVPGRQFGGLKGSCPVCDKEKP